MKTSTNRKTKGKGSRAIRFAILIPAAVIALVLVAGVAVNLALDAEPIPLTDLAATYKGEIKDANSNLLVPFDVAYPEEFASGAHEYRKDALLLKMDGSFGGRMTRELEKCGFASIELSVATANGTPA